MDVFYTELELPSGKVFAAATVRGIALLDLEPGPLDVWLDRLSAEHGVAPVRDKMPFIRLMDELGEYFNGTRKVFTVPLDVHGTPFQEKVWAALLRVPYGSIVTYGMIARMAGSPGAARAAGGALNKNRVPIIIPCHRVVASGGNMGGYGAGLDVKRLLLELEGVRPPYRASETA